MKILPSLLTALFCCCCNSASAQEIPLYDQNIPNSHPAKIQERTETTPDAQLFVYGITKPTLTAFLPPAKTANRTAVIICPGGGYEFVSASHEGSDVAKKLNEIGVAAFVLKYRIPADESMPKKEIGPLQDAQRAIQIVRQNASKWNVNVNRVGMMGFSAGGHLASTAGTHFMKATIDNHDTSLRPDFLILVYPVISFSNSIAHLGSRANLIGKNPSPQNIQEYSNELQVTAQTPPSFLIHAQDDDVVKVENSILFFEALNRNHVPAEMHIYTKGGHGFGLHNPTTKDEWFDRLKNWLAANGWCDLAASATK
jgi:acetyl esterase/lipase